MIATTFSVLTNASPWYEQVGIIAASATGTVSFMVLCSKLRVVRWVIKTLIGDPVMRFLERHTEDVAAKLDEKQAAALLVVKDQADELKAQTDRIEATTSETNHLVVYHLGPNGSTKPVHERLSTVEDRLG